MPRHKFQRPKVRLAGNREKFWMVRYREYFIGSDGKEDFHQKTATWSKEGHTRGEAQDKCDKLMAQLRQGGPKADGSMTLREFWDQVFRPIRSRRWELNSKSAFDGAWRNHISKDLGTLKLEDITKATIELHLGRLVDRGCGEATVKGVLTMLSSMLGEAADNEYIHKNPIRRVEIPRCRPTQQTRSMTEGEAARLIANTEGSDNLIWRTLLLTGPRIGELLALKRDDILPDGVLRIDESAVWGRLKCPKNGKVRYAPLPTALRADLEAWLGTHASPLIFPSPKGKLQHRSSKRALDILERARTAAGIPDLTFRMCRTTFATLWEGKTKDAQEILGHHSERFTRERYERSIAERAAASTESLSKRLAEVVPIDKVKKAG